MTNKLTNRIMKIEKRTGPADISKWMRSPIREIPDWVLFTLMFDRPVSPAEANRLNRDEEVGRRIELCRSIGEENDEFFAGRSDLIDYVERVHLRALPSADSSDRVRRDQT